MAVNLNLTIRLASLHCHDEGDGWGNAAPYLWPVFEFQRRWGEDEAEDGDWELFGWFTSSVVIPPGNCNMDSMFASSNMSRGDVDTSFGMMRRFRDAEYGSPGWRTGGEPARRRPPS